MRLADRLTAAHDALRRGDGPAAVCHALDCLSIMPNSAEAAFLLGLVSYPVWFARTLTLAPDHLGAAVHLALSRDAAGMRASALRVLRRSIGALPSAVPSLVNLGLLLTPETAQPWLMRATALAPDDVLVRVNLGTILDRRHLPGPAAREHRRAMVLAPGLPLASVNLAMSLFGAGRMEEAAGWHRRALTGDPLSADAWAGLGSVAREKGRAVDGRTFDRRALAARPGHAATLANLCHGDLLAAEVPSALAWSLRAEATDPGSPALGSATLAIMQYLAWNDQRVVFDSHRRWAMRHASSRPRPARRTGGEPLRVGYVSADFRRHPVGLFALPLIEAHEPKNVDTFCYSTNSGSDGVTARLHAASSRWRQVDKLNDADLADLIRADCIDILVDLAGHTAGNRLPLFAARPAPVQVTWLGYYDTTGMDVFDAAFVDPWEVTAGMERWYSEPVVKLACGRLVFRPPAPAPAVALRRSDSVLKLGCFNNPAKIGYEAIALWSRVLTAVPGARLMLKSAAYGDERVRAEYLRRFVAAGADPQSIGFSGWSPHAEMLAELTELDIVLDPLPFSGCLTSCEALWMGVPLVTLAGRRPVERQTTALLTRLGLDRLIAATWEDYVEIVRRLADDPSERDHIRHGLRQRMLGSSLCDEKGFAETVEAAYRRLWLEVA